MRAPALAPLVSLALLLAAAPARAEEGPLGRAPNLVTVEGIFAFASLHATAAEGNATETNWVFGTVGTLGGAGALEGGGPSLLRLGYHRVLGPVTLGSGFFYGTAQGTSNLALAPRLGFVVPVGETAALWPRFGVTYGRQANDAVTVEQTYLAGELLFVITPVSHFGVLFGPFLETGVSSSVTHHAGPFGNTPDRTADGPKYRVIGVSLGFLFDF